MARSTQACLVNPLARSSPPGQRIHVVSRRGKIEVDARVTDICMPGVVSMTFHFADTPTNVLTNNAVDPVAKIPETKVCAVRVELAD